MTCIPWEADLGCVGDEEWSGFDSDAQERASELAWASLRHLTGQRVGNCPVMARPCGSGYSTRPGMVMSPYVSGGSWFNVVCGHTGGCGCTEIAQIAFPGPIARIDSVHLDGALLDPDAYRVDNGHLLVRQDGEGWPLCQDMNVPWDGPGAFAITYVPGIEPGPAGLWAAGLLTVEFARACAGGKCRLPNSVTSLARQGVSMTFSEGMFAGGNTGIREVDAYVLSVNPNHLKQPSRVWSPDQPAARYSGVPTP